MLVMVPANFRGIARPKMNDGAVPTCDDAKAVVLDLVQPAGRFSNE
jgi:hypothetical protein